MFNPIGYYFRLTATQLSRIGLIDSKRGTRIADLAWPRFLTMFARYLHQVADAAMVGLAIGPAAIAGLGFASVYWGIANAFALGLAGGTISQVSQRFSIEQSQQLELAVKQSVWIGVILAVPFIVVYILFTEPLIGLMGNEVTTIAFGAAYLQIYALALVFNVLNLVASRTLAGADDTWIAMAIRATGALINIIFNVIFIFGLDMGVEGAALGTVLAEGLITVCFTWGFVTGYLPIVGRFPLTLSLSQPYFDRELTKQLLTITPPIMIQKLAREFARFPLFAILAIFGPVVIAAFEVAFRIRNLMLSTGNGFSMSTSTLVGQKLGQGDEVEADQYAKDSIYFSAVIYITASILVFVAARPLAYFFVDDPDAIEQTVPFIRIAAVSFAALGIDYTFMGILKAAGDNKWSMYGRLVGQYLALVPITYLGTITSFGVTAVFLAMVIETTSAATITGYRFTSGNWKIISRAHRPETTN